LQEGAERPDSVRASIFSRRETRHQFVTKNLRFGVSSGRSESEKQDRRRDWFSDHMIDPVEVSGSGSSPFGPTISPLDAVPAIFPGIVRGIAGAKNFSWPFRARTTDRAPELLLSV
jgi:hypothetical protein